MAVTFEPGGPFAAGATVPLIASSDDQSGVASWQWAVGDKAASVFRDINGADNSKFELVVDDYAGKTLRATATLDSGSEDVGKIQIEKAPAAEGGGGNGDGPPAEPPSVWHVKFAWISAAVAIALLVAFVVFTSLEEARLGLDDTAYKKLDGRGLVGAAVIGPIALLGVAVTLVGVWMVAVEWRGRFAPEEDTGFETKGFPDVGTVVAALGKLKGATLVLLSGVTILLAVAWMTSATTGAEPTPSPTSTGTATTTAAPTGGATSP